MDISRIKRTLSEPDADVITSTYEVHTAAGIFTITKQFYAQGPSLFEWIIDGPEHLIETMPSTSFSTKKAAVKCIRSLPNV